MCKQIATEGLLTAELESVVLEEDAFDEQTQPIHYGLGYSLVDRMVEFPETD